MYQARSRRSFPTESIVPPVRINAILGKLLPMPRIPFFVPRFVAQSTYSATKSIFSLRAEVWKPIWSLFNFCNPLRNLKKPKTFAKEGLRALFRGVPGNKIFTRTHFREA